MRSLLLAMVLLGGCVEGAEEPLPASRIHIDEASVNAVTTDDEVDLCALANELDTDNVCSLICDPDAMADFLLAEGMAGGQCIQLRCQLPGLDPIFVGVCIAP